MLGGITNPTAHRMPNVGCHGMNGGSVQAGILEYTGYLPIDLLLRWGSILRFYLSVLAGHGSSFDEDAVGEWFVRNLLSDDCWHHARGSAPGSPNCGGSY